MRVVALARSWSMSRRPRARSGHVLCEPVEHGLRAALELHVAALELHVAVPSRGCALDPLQLLLGQGDVVEHRLDVARIGEDVAANLVEERRHVDALGPLLRDALLEPDACAQPDEGVEVVEAIAEAYHGQAAFDDDPGSDRLRRYEAADTVERH